MGEHAEDALASTDISVADCKKYQTVINKFDKFERTLSLNVRDSIDAARKRASQPNITSLYSLADNCNYGDLKDDLIRDHIIVGIPDKAFSERLWKHFHHSNWMAESSAKTMKSLLDN